MRKNQRKKRPVVFLDKTWANAQDGKLCDWVERNVITGGTLGVVRYYFLSCWYLSVSRDFWFIGDHLEKVHGSSLFEQVVRVVKSKKNTGDYHDEMISEHFEEWFSESLIPNVPTNSLIVIDNATYHSRRIEPLPVKSWTKKRMTEWIQVKRMTEWIQYPEKPLNLIYLCHHTKAKAYSPICSGRNGGS